MDRMRRFSLGLAFLGLAGPTAFAEGRMARVHVYAREVRPLDEADKKAREKEMEAARKRAEQARKGVGQALEAKHGKRMKDWPDEARRQFDEAWRAELRAELAHQEVKVEQKDLKDAARALTEALRDAIKKSTRVTVAESGDQADLQVQVLARAARTSFPAAAWMLYLEIKPVGWPDPASFAGTPFEQPRTKKVGVGLLASLDARGAVATAHVYTEAEPYWVVRVFQQGTSYGVVADAAAEVLAAFCEAVTEGPQRASR